LLVYNRLSEKPRGLSNKLIIAYISHKHLQLGRFRILMHELDIGDEDFECRVSAYSEMNRVVLVAALNEHAHGMNFGAFNQTKFFDLRCLTEALIRSELDISDLPIIDSKISNGKGHHYFKLQNMNKITLIDLDEHLSRYIVNSTEEE